MNTTRCQNCFRLKRECQFFPVDQMTLPDSKRNRSTTKIDTQIPDSETSVSSSPGVKVGTAMEQFDPFKPQISPSVPPGPSVFSALSGSPELIRNTGVLSGHVVVATLLKYLHLGQQYEYQQHFEPHSWEHTTAIEQVPQYSADRPFNPSPRSYWQSHDSNQNTTFPHSSYSNSQGTIGTSAASHEQTFAYTNSITGPSVYHFQPQLNRVTDTSIADHEMNPFGMYRSHTLPNPDRPTGGIAPPTFPTNIRSQTMTNPQYINQPHASSYSQSSGVTPRWTESSHMNSSHAHDGRSQSWYNNPPA